MLKLQNKRAMRQKEKENGKGRIRSIELALNIHIKSCCNMNKIPLHIECMCVSGMNDQMVNRLLYISAKKLNVIHICRCRYLCICFFSGINSGIVFRI